MKKDFLIVVSILFSIWLTGIIFNHISPWAGIGFAIVVIYLLIFNLIKEK